MARERFSGQDLGEELRRIQKRLDSVELLTPDIVINLLLSFRDIQVRVKNIIRLHLCWCKYSQSHGCFVFRSNKSINFFLLPSCSFCFVLFIFIFFTGSWFHNQSGGDSKQPALVCDCATSEYKVSLHICSQQVACTRVSFLIWSLFFSFHLLISAKTQRFVRTHLKWKKHLPCQEESPRRPGQGFGVDSASCGVQGEGGVRHLLPVRTDLQGHVHELWLQWSEQQGSGLLLVQTEIPFHLPLLCVCLWLLKQFPRALFLLGMEKLSKRSRLSTPASTLLCFWWPLAMILKRPSRSVKLVLEIIPFQTY